MASWWRPQMETLPALLALCEGNPPVTSGFPHKGQWRGTLVFSLICERLSRQSRCRWFETPSRSLWCHCNVMIIYLEWWRDNVITHLVVSECQDCQWNNVGDGRYERCVHMTWHIRGPALVAVGRPVDGFRWQSSHPELDARQSCCRHPDEHQNTLSASLCQAGSQWKNHAPISENRIPRVINS